MCKSTSSFRRGRNQPSAADAVVSTTNARAPGGEDALSAALPLIQLMITGRSIIAPKASMLATALPSAHHAMALTPPLI